MILEKSITIGPHACVMKLTSQGEFTCRWRDMIPKKLTKEQLEEYLAGRNALVTEMATQLGTANLISGAYKFALWEAQHCNWRDHAHIRGGIKILRGEVHMHGADHTETTELLGRFTFQAGQRDVREYPPGSTVEIADDEAVLLITRGQAERVASDAPLSAGQQGDKYTMAAVPVLLRDGRRVERMSDGTWGAVANPRD